MDKSKQLMQDQHYFPPLDHPLHPYVASIWRVEGKSLHKYETVLPKQNVDFLFNFGASQLAVKGANAHSMGINDFQVVGPQTGAFTVAPQGDVKMLGISLKMDGSSALFSLPITEIVDQAVEACCLFPQQRFLWEQMAETESFRKQCNILMNWLMGVFQPAPQLDLVQHACWSLREQPTSYTLDQLSAQLNLSSRHLRRLMRQHIGVGPAQYMRLSRFVKSLHLMTGMDTLTDIAYHVNYADQAHFSRDFKEIAGMTPSEYRQRMSHVPGHIFSL